MNDGAGPPGLGEAEAEAVACCCWRAGDIGEADDEDSGGLNELFACGGGVGDVAC